MAIKRFVSKTPRLAGWRVAAGMCLVLSAPAFAAKGVDAIQLETAVISGNQELPRVLYVLPWRKEPGEAVLAGAVELKAGVLYEPVKPLELRRRQHLRGQADETQDVATSEALATNPELAEK